MPGDCEKWESMVVVAVRPRGLGGGVLETELIKEGLTSPRCHNKACDSRGLSDAVNFLYVCMS